MSPAWEADQLTTFITRIFVSLVVTQIHEQGHIKTPLLSSTSSKGNQLTTTTALLFLELARQEINQLNQANRACDLVCPEMLAYLGI